MSLYREPGQARRRRRLIAAVTVAAVVVIALVIALVARSSGPPGHAERVKAAHAAAGQALDGLELVEIEYGQAVRDGRVVAPTEYQAAKGDVQRARDALVQHRDDVQAVDPAGLARAERALDAVRAAVEERVATAALHAKVAEARAIVTRLSR